MNNYKYIDISKLPEEAFGNIKNIIALDSQNEVIKAEKEDTYSKEEIDELINENKPKNLKWSTNTDYVVTQPTVSGNSLVITDAMSDKNQFHTFGFDKTTKGTVFVPKYINITRGYNAVPEMETDVEDGIDFEVYENGGSYGASMSGNIPLELDKINEVTNILHYEVTYVERDDNDIIIGGVDPTVADVTYDPITKLLSTPELGLSFAQIIRTDTNTYIFGGGTDGNEYFEDGRLYYNFEQYPLEEGASLIWMPYYSSNLFWDYSVTINNIFSGEGDVTTNDKPYLLNDYIRYENDEKAYILTDMNYHNVIKNKDVKINSSSTDYTVTQPIVSGDNIVITDVVSDKNQYHTFGFDKTFSKEDWVYRTDFVFEESNNKYYSCPDWDVDNNTLTMSVNSESYGQFRFTYFDFVNGVPSTSAIIDITVSEGSITLSKNAEYPNPSNKFAGNYNNILKVSVDGTYISYFPNVYTVGSVSKTFGDNSKIVFKLGKIGEPAILIPPQIKTTREQNILKALETVTAQTYDYPERLNDYIRYSNDEKAYILTDMNYQNVIKEWVGTQEEYDALETIDNNTTYYITE